jgi:hypothetical protein
MRRLPPAKQLARVDPGFLVRKRVVDDGNVLCGGLKQQVRLVVPQEAATVHVGAGRSAVPPVSGQVRDASQPDAQLPDAAGLDHRLDVRGLVLEAVDDVDDDLACWQLDAIGAGRVEHAIARPVDPRIGGGGRIELPIARGHMYASRDRSSRLIVDDVDRERPRGSLPSSRGERDRSTLAARDVDDDELWKIGLVRQHGELASVRRPAWKEDVEIGRGKGVGPL